MSELSYRYLKASPDSVKEAADGSRTLTCCFSSETPVLRRDKEGAEFFEVLSHDAADADVSMLQNGGAFLDEHLPHRQIGSINRAWIDRDKKGRAEIAFGATALGNERFELMSSGHRKDVSFGYQLTKVLNTTRNADGKKILRFAWKAFEISSVAVGADHGIAGVGRSIQITQHRKSKIMNDPRNKTAEMVALERAFLHDWPHIEHEIKQTHARALCESMSISDYKTAMNELIQRNPRPRILHEVLNHKIGMEGRDVKGYSIARAIRSFVENKGKLEGFELDCHQQCEKNSRSSAEGFFVPLDVIAGTREQRSLGYGRRDMTVADDGVLVPTLVQTSIIELLRNRTVALRMGATMLGGLTGNVSIPRQTSTSTAQSLGEIQEITSSEATFDQVPVTPHRVGASTIYGKQLVIQSAPDVETFVRNDLTKTVGIKHDYLVINGSGTNDEPLGILNTPNVGTLNFDGAASWAKIVELETALGDMNADSGQLAYVTTPRVKGAWKTIAVALTGATTVSAGPLWETFNFADGSNDGIVNGYRAASTLQVPLNKIIFGNWNDLIFGMFGGWDMVVDPYTLAKKAEIVVTVNTWIDSVLRHPQSFCVSGDAGNQ